jgi:hypothetical protein
MVLVQGSLHQRSLRAPIVSVFQFPSASMEFEKQLFLFSCESFSAPGGDMEYHEATIVSKFINKIVLVYLEANK